MQDAKEILGDLAGDAKMYMGHGANFTAYPISRGTELNVVAFKRTSKPWTHSTLTKEVSREEMIADFDVDKRLLRLLDWAKPLQWSLWHHHDTPIYYNGRVCLLGDVAHATTPHQAAGAGQCLEDAYVLSHLLATVRKPDDLENVFKAYDSVRRPRAQKVVSTSTETGLLYNFIHPEAGSDMSKIVDNLNQRFLWIWEHDLEADVRKAKEQLARPTRDVDVPSKGVEQVQVAAVEVV
jgi:salicylate hydroxylase